MQVKDCLCLYYIYIISIPASQVFVNNSGT